MDINDLCAGREMDALVAEKVMGWKRIHASTLIPPDPVLDIWCDGYGVSPKAQCYAWRPSTDISAAWAVAEKMLITPCRTFGLLFDEATDTWIAKFDRGRCVFDDCGFSFQADTAPLAICRCALKVALAAPH